MRAAHAGGRSTQLGGEGGGVCARTCAVWAHDRELVACADRERQVAEQRALAVVGLCQLLGDQQHVAALAGRAHLARGSGARPAWGRRRGGAGGGAGAARACWGARCRAWCSHGRPSNLLATLQAGTGDGERVQPRAPVAPALTCHCRRCCGRRSAPRRRPCRAGCRSPRARQHAAAGADVPAPRKRSARLPHCQCNSRGQAMLLRSQSMVGQDLWVNLTAHASVLADDECRERNRVHEICDACDHSDGGGLEVGCLVPTLIGCADPSRSV